MADVIKEVAETAKEAGMDVEVMEPVLVEGPTIFKTSNAAKIVFGVVAGVAAAYGVYKGVKCVMKKRKDTKEDLETDDISEERHCNDAEEVEDDEE